MSKMKNWIKNILGIISLITVIFLITFSGVIMHFNVFEKI